MSQAERTVAEKAVEALAAEDREWLDERLAEYSELLDYLHDH